MKRIFLIFISMLLVFGCVGGPAPSANVTTGNISAPPQVPLVNQTVPSLCDPSYTFTDPNPATLSGSGTLSVSADCATGANIEVYVNGAVAGKSVVPGDPAVLNFNLVASKDGVSKVEVKSDGKSIHSVDWDVSSIGYLNTDTSDVDPISINHRKAISFDLANPVRIRSVSTYLKRQSALTLGSNIVLEIRKDMNGVPGQSVYNTTVPITEVTLSPNWLSFPVDASLQKGRHWLVFWVDKDNDYVNIHYVPVDKKAKGNADHLNMDYVKNEDLLKWEPTEWKPLSFDRKYVFKVSAVQE